MPLRSIRSIALFLGLSTSLAAVLPACNDKPAAPSTPATAPTVPGTPTAAPTPPPAELAKPGEGVVMGQVTFVGQAPEMAELNRGADPFCAKDKMKDEEVVLGAKGELKNVIVRVVGAPPMAGPETPVELDQDRCMYKPRVVALVAGQTLKIKNSDKTLHNIHTYKGSSTIFNVAQVPNMPPIEKHFGENGLLVKLKCDVHQWMTGYAWVQNNPLFAVTGDDGKFEIKGLPDGSWDIEAWHERFGTQKGKITVAGAKPVEWKVEFKAAP